MLWGCIAASVTGNISRVEGKMDSIRFQQILDANLMPSVKKLKLKRDWLLQMENDPKHTSKSTVDYIKRRNLKVLPWPSQSPDLNIIENLWIDLKRAVRHRQPRNLKELEDFCKEVWAKIPQTRIERLLAGYKKRLQAVILAKGGSTRKYSTEIHICGMTISFNYNSRCGRPGRQCSCGRLVARQRMTRSRDTIGTSGLTSSASTHSGWMPRGTLPEPGLLQRRGVFRASKYKVGKSLAPQFYSDTGDHCHNQGLLQKHLPPRIKEPPGGNRMFPKSLLPQTWMKPRQWICKPSPACLSPQESRRTLSRDLMTAKWTQLHSLAEDFREKTWVESWMSQERWDLRLKKMKCHKEALSWLVELDRFSDRTYFRKIRTTRMWIRCQLLPCLFLQHFEWWRIFNKDKHLHVSTESTPWLWSFCNIRTTSEIP
ncbi:uncharacterized protein LOC134949303 isoform X1 [Pseudophryne corroboree]|uniref:uncharacterized protein LOC134949303 isoform X1 n=1 Tax=Pseudophryne corroboree TaxID=495146 RepID=UPI00308129DF